jgi:hypothetical protein
VERVDCDGKKEVFCIFLFNMTPFETAYSEVAGLIREQLDWKCEWMNSEIDRLVCELYGLSKEEIKIVKGP